MLCCVLCAVCWVVLYCFCSAVFSGGVLGPILGPWKHRYLGSWEILRPGKPRHLGSWEILGILGSSRCEDGLGFREILGDRGTWEPLRSGGSWDDGGTRFPRSVSSTPDQPPLLPVMLALWRGCFCLRYTVSLLAIVTVCMARVFFCLRHTVSLLVMAAVWREQKLSHRGRRNRGSGSHPSSPQPAHFVCVLKTTQGLLFLGEMPVWPSGLRRWLQAPVRKESGWNPTCDTLSCICGVPVSQGSLPERRLRPESLDFEFLPRS